MLQRCSIFLFIDCVLGILLILLCGTIYPSNRTISQHLSKSTHHINTNTNRVMDYTLCFRSCIDKSLNFNKGVFVKIQKVTHLNAREQKSTEKKCEKIHSSLYFFCEASYVLCLIPEKMNHVKSRVTCDNKAKITSLCS